jgi:signal transduction histidine kinase
MPFEPAPLHPPAAPAIAPKPTGTHFAAPERLTEEQLRAQLQQLGAHPLIGALLNTAGGLLAVLNGQRQVLMVNESLLAYLGVDSAEKLLGLRLGEILECPHATEMAGGCGTSRFCSTCGAAIAQAVVLQHRESAERLCAIDVSRGDAVSSLYLRIRATPLSLEGYDLILVFIEDVTRQQQSVLAERSFHHDLNNTLTCLLQASELLVADAQGELAASAEEIYRLTQRVIHELQLQRQLLTTNLEELHPATSTVKLSTLLDDLRRMVGHHPAAAGKRTTLQQPAEDFAFITDATLLLRVLANMAINALEATPSGGEIRIRVETAPDRIDFRVWNETAIPPEVALRIFQRNFSTKGSLGRGLGTYSMKLVGERLLGGRVTFESSALAGTTFRFLLPLGAAVA